MDKEGHGGKGTMSNEQVASETKGVMVKLLATVDLGSEIKDGAAVSPVA